MILENKVVLITGATGGLGRVATQRMAEAGARLVLLSRDIGHLTSLADGLEIGPDRILTQAIDLTDPLAVDEAVQAVHDQFGRLDVILHLVGGWVGGEAIIDLDPENLALMLEQHAWSTLHVAQKFVPLQIANHWGRFMVVSSPAATAPSAKGAPYAMGKAAQQALVLTLAQELKGSGVTANILSVKAIDVDHTRENSPSAKNANWATPEEIVAAMLYLCSQEAQLINGAILPIYGSA